MKPVIVAELIRHNQGFDEGDLIGALWDLYEAVRGEHNRKHYESECPQCIAVKEIERLSEDPSI